VIEAAEKSGSLVTAKYAIEQNRDVFAVPGNINNPLSRGPHILIQQGAKLVSELDDIIEEFVWVESSGQAQQKKNLAESKLLASVDHDTTPVDVIVQRSNLPVEQVLIELLDLEVQGLVAAVPGGYIRQA
jgi:DNA processing protein